MSNKTKLHRVAKARRIASSGAGRAMREAAGIGLNELARELGTSPSSLSRWERALVAPNPHHALRWLTALEGLDP
jgi:transcriptional regulator with XRE-family HTH domain